MTTNPTTERTYLSCAETAKLLRGALKAAHPGTKFTVRSNTYSGGASIDVGWTDGPTERVVKATADLYSGGSFDGMIDLMSYHDSVLTGPDGSMRVVHFGADFVFTNRSYTEEFLASVEPAVTDTGHDGQSSQCQGCGSWLPAGQRHVAQAFERTLFVCSPPCGARIVARHTERT